MGIRQVFETGRQTLRRHAPSGLYMRAAGVYHAARVIGRMGAGNYRVLSKARSAAAGGSTVVALPTLANPIRVRHGTSDAVEVMHTVGRATYAAYAPPEARVVIDAGANIGDSTAWFLSRYPSATVVALEPNAGNYAMLVENSAAYGPRAVPLHAALWTRPARLTVVDGASDNDFRVEESTDGPVRGLTPGDLIDEYAAGGPVDIFKIDIEGAEEALFAADAAQWLGRVRHVVVDVHSEAAGRAIRAAFAGLPFDFHPHRETYVFTRRPGAA